LTDFRIRIVIDPGPATTGAKKVESQLKRTEGTADRLRATLLRTFAGVGLTLGIAGSIRLLADYSQAMSTVQAVTGATAEQFDLLDQKAQDLGRSTRFAATQAAEGMVLLARAGFTAEESLGAVEGTLTLAQAGGLDLATAADIAANSLRGFRLEVGETGRVVDVLATSANSANTTVQQLGEGMKFVAPIAAGLDVSLETTAAAMAKLSDSGLQAGLAGTGLRRVLSELESPSQKTSQILSDLGLSTDDVRVSQVGLVAALQALRDAGLDTGQALEVFGDRGGPAFEVLSNNIPAIEELTKKLEASGGTAKRVSDIMDDNLNGALLRLRSAFEGLIIGAADTQGGFTALEVVINGLASGINFLTDNIDGLGAALTVLSVGLLLTKTSMVATSASAIGAAVAFLQQTVAATALTFSLGGVTSFALGAAGALKALALASITNPFVLIIAGAAAAFVAVQKLTKGIEEYEAALKIAEGGELSGLTEFGKLGAQIQDAEKKLEQYDKRLASGNITQQQYDTVTGSIVAKVERLREAQDKLSASTDKARTAAAEVVQEQNRLNAGYERSLKALDDEQKLLGLANRERDVQAELMKEIAAIQEEGGPELNGRQLEELDLRIRRNQALREEADALDGIRGPQERFIQDLETLKRLQDQDIISLDEFNKALKDLAANADDIDLSKLELPEGLSADVDLSGTIAQIQAALRLEQERIETEQRYASIIRDIRGVELERQQRIADLNSLLALNIATFGAAGITLAEFNAEVAKLNRETADLPLVERIAQLNAQFASGELTQAKYINEMQRLEQFKGPSAEFLAGLAKLNEELAAGTITAEEFLEKFRELGDKAENPLVTFSDGAGDAMSRLEDQSKTTGEIVSDGLVAAFNRSADALAEFATTGKLDFKELARSILADLARIIAQELLLKAVKGVTGVTGAASGGDFEANQTMLVGEKGPELVRFGQGGNVTPADQTKQALAASGAGGGGAPTVNVAPAEVKVQVVNVASPDEARSAMDTSEGGKVILNQVRSNRAALRRELGIG